MHEICRKDRLARRVARISRILAKDYNFFPQSWILPEDWQDFVSAYKPRKGHCFISKPEHGCQGKGIFLFKEPKSLCMDTRPSMVVQNYISSPCTIDGFKFDLRVYVLVTSVSPLRIFVYRDGLARFATEKYQIPTAGNRKMTQMHLTNYAINKNSESFIHDPEKGSKRSIISVLEELEKRKVGCSQKIWHTIHQAIIKTIILVQPELSKSLKSWIPADQTAKLENVGSQCFEILGFDILLDSKLKPWVLEVNHSPSFTCDSPLDKEIKSGVIRSALKLLNISAISQKKILKEQKRQSLSRLLKATEKKVADVPETLESIPNSDLLPENIANVKEKYRTAVVKYFQKFGVERLENLAKIEEVNMGNYQRVFPPEDLNSLGKFLTLAEGISIEAKQTNAIKTLQAFRIAKQEEVLIQEEKLSQWKLKRNKMGIQPRINDIAHKLNSQSLASIERLEQATIKSDIVPGKVSLVMKVQNLNDSISISKKMVGQSSNAVGLKRNKVKVNVLQKYPQTSNLSEINCLSGLHILKK
jgi:hypothetical protein